MRSWIRERLSWLLVAALIVLLVLLGGMQQRWIGALGRAQSERLHAEFERAGQRFGGELERELARVFVAFLLEPGPGPEAREVRYLRRLREWRQGGRAPLVESLALARRQRGAEPSFEIADPGAGRYRPAPWPPELMGLRRRLERGTPGSHPEPEEAGIGSPLALLVPSLAEGGRTEDGDEQGERRGSWRLDGVAIVFLSRTYLRETLLPELAEAHFGSLEGAEFSVTVVAGPEREVLYASDPAASPGESRPGDLHLRLPLLHRPRGRHPHAPLEMRAERGRPGPPPGAAWELILRHRSGSLEAAVEAHRHRNLVNSMGILVLIGATAVLLALGDRRARRLARQQLEFVAGVTHELHTPLTALRSAGQNLADGIVTEAQQVRRYGGLIERESARLAALIGQVLEFAGIQSGARAYASEPLILKEVVQQAVGDLGLVLEQSGLTVEQSVPSDLPEVGGDAPALRRALENLLTNAAKFASAGGVVSVRAEQRGAHIELRVEDRGPGIPADERKRVLEPFFRGRAAQSGRVPGNGLGLSLVRHVLQAHGGSVRVEARDGGGTAVVLLLPVAARS